MAAHCPLLLTASPTSACRAHRYRPATSSNWPASALRPSWRAGRLVEYYTRRVLSEAKITIRPISTGVEVGDSLGSSREIEIISALSVAAYASDYELTADYLAEVGDVAGRVRTAEVWVAERAGELVGTITVPRAGERLHDDTLPEEMDVRLLAVASSARGAGVGEALMRHCVALASARGAQRLVLHTASMMLGARRLYERMGFERISEREYEFETMGETRELMVYGIAADPGQLDPRAQRRDRAREEAQSVDA